MSAPSTRPASRSADHGALPGLAELCPSDLSLEMFRRMCRARHFDEQAFLASRNGWLQSLVYLSVGQESIAAAISTVMGGAWIFTQHRGHAAYLSFGGDIEKLIDELIGLPTGCCRGMGGSPCIHDPNIRMIGHEGLIAEHVPIAVGAAYASPDSPVVCFFGDGAVEEDYFFGALGFAATHNLKVLFVCEDNDLSVLTPTSDRRSWEIHEVARSFGIRAVDVADDPWLVHHHVSELSRRLPAFLNCRTCRCYWHVGAGQDGPPEWDRFNIVKQQLAGLGLENAAATIEAESKAEIERLWKSRLQTPSAT
ncbi:MAG: hypothetical protein HY360_00020 [Verrucomicrobia bacterium]|nr:hypothetical protein [Verrucomicrobiota bacterium]